MSELGNIEQHLRETIGLDVHSVGGGSLAVAVQVRMRKRGLRQQREYLAMLLERASEQQALIEEMVVPETWFFRDWKPFELLGHWAATRWLPAHPTGVLRILSAPCSTGEEPFSMVMALLDAGVEPHRFSVEAWDISHRAIAHARKGVYSQNSFRGEHREFREKYFEKTGNGWQLSEQVLKQVQFAHANLAVPASAESGTSRDVIFCRNLLIYLTPEMQTGLLGRLRAMLSPEGLLFVGHAEAFIASQCGFETTQPPLAFAFRKRSAGAKSAPAKPLGPLRPLGPFRPITPMEGRAVPPPPAPKPARPPKPKEAPPAQSPHAALQAIQALADGGNYKAAKAQGEICLHTHGPSSTLFCLLGLIHEATGELDPAREFYRKALYLEPGHVETLAHMALLERKAGNRAAALRLEQRAHRLQQEARIA